MKLKLFRRFLLFVIGMNIPALSFAAESKLIEVDNQNDKDDLIRELGNSQSLVRNLTGSEISARATIFSQYQPETTFAEAFAKVSAENGSLSPFEVKQKLDDIIKHLLERKLIVVDEQRILSSSPSRGGGSGTGAG